MIAWWIDIQYIKKGQSKYIPIWTVKCYAYCIEHVQYEFFNLIGVGNGTEKPINDLFLALSDGKTIHARSNEEKSTNYSLKFDPLEQKGKKINKTVTFFVIKKKLHVLQITQKICIDCNPSIRCYCLLYRICAQRSIVDYVFIKRSL